MFALNRFSTSCHYREILRIDFHVIELASTFELPEQRQAMSRELKEDPVRERKRETAESNDTRRRVGTTLKYNIHHQIITSSKPALHAQSPLRPRSVLAFLQL